MLRLGSVALPGLLLALSPRAIALNPALDVSQYAHTSWTARDGLFKGYVSAIAQTPDGYLWLGTEFGLLRFDGIRTVPWQPPEGKGLRSDRISALLAARDGTLWIGTMDELVSWKDGQLTHHAELDGLFVPNIFQDREGVIWAQGSLGSANAKLCAFRSGHPECFGGDGTFGRYVNEIYEDNAGAFWVSSFKGLWRWSPGPPKLFPLEEPTSALADVIDGDDGALWMAMRGGISRLIGDKPVKHPLWGRRQFRANRLFRDRDGGLWIGTIDRGLLHYYRGKADAFGRSDGLSNDDVSRIFEDREGNIWVSTSAGLDRFRDFPVPRLSTRQGLSNDLIVSVLAARDGSLWLASFNGLNRWKGGKITVYRNQSWSPEGARPASNEVVDRGLRSNGIESLREDNRGRILVSTPAGLAIFEDGHFVRGSDVPQEVFATIEDGPDSFRIADLVQGLVHLSEGRVVQRIPWADFGRPNDFAISLLRDPVQGGLWIGFVRGGMVYFQDGKNRLSIENVGRVSQFQIDSTGVLWAATERGLSRIGTDRIDTLSGRNGLPCDAVSSVIEDDDHALWMNSACGVLRIARSDLSAWINDRSHKVQVLLLDESDGAVSHSVPDTYSPRVAKAADGTLWFADTADGVSVVDPHHLPLNQLPPPVHIEQIIADHKPASSLRLPALTRDLEIDYTALSFVAPEKNRFKYKLEGYDDDWRDAGNRREAYYANLGPRQYRFRVQASNNNGVWNEAGASLDFSIAPAYYQTIWFRLSAVAAFFALLWGLYRYRLYQIAREFNVRMEERVGERTRIARELHDTLLQSFQGSLFEFQAARNLLSRRPEQALQSLDNAIGGAEAAIAEGRDAIQNLRSGSGVRSDLAHLLRSTGRELSNTQGSNGDGPTFSMTVEGPPQALPPVLQDEIYRIGREILRNAFQHARARQIEVEVRYDDHELRLRIRDDGIGIDPKLLHEGARPGHWGLPGVRERAKLVGARLDFWSEARAGTEVQVAIPASVAYLRSRGARTLKLFRKTKGSHGD